MDNKENPDVKHFLAIPWCAALINAPGTMVAMAGARIPKDNTEDELFSKTLNTDRTIVAYVMLSQQRPPPTPTSTPKAGQLGHDSSGNSSGAREKKDNAAGEGEDLIRELRSLVTFGSGVNGYNNVAHGGVVATILDETMVRLLAVNRDEGLIKDDCVTAYLKTEFLRPLLTPQTILVTATLSRVQGRKWWTEGRIEDGNGRVIAKAESMYVALMGKL